ncbi:hepatocyte growth factor receptor [Striga asiatica]|uniref:Hepatocyte growth factor receptor n=1 Tax=Striga asiatica TaxID=4170 RepID=A0A5A7PHN3_STRAF|nr:hepatocyte growth factor receptor [Striga asiatica]
MWMYLAISLPIPEVEPVTTKVRSLMGGRSIGLGKLLAIILWNSISYARFNHPISHSIHPSPSFFSGGFPLFFSFPFFGEAIFVRVGYPAFQSNWTTRADRRFWRVERGRRYLSWIRALSLSSAVEVRNRESSATSGGVHRIWYGPSSVTEGE